jgi:ribosomal protein S18 acetylase RimI-like enzyme
MKSSFNLEFFHSSFAPFKAQDKLALIEFDRLYFPYSWPIEDWDKYLLIYSYSAVRVKDESDQVQGLLLCLGSVEEDVAHLVKIVVHPQQRQQGQASLLLEYWCDQMKTLGQHKSLYLEVEKNNHAAINFYHKHQFLVLRTLKDFYGPKRDAQAMALALDNKENT